jgi:ABC transporter with metal-binding/Fe-S-binding domain ATP-binding protein
MKLAALFSGGKDSTYSIYKAKLEGHQVVCLITIHPLSDESMLLHFPNTQLTKLQSESMNIPQLTIDSISNDPDSESKILEEILNEAKKKHGIEGVVHGGISSKYQKKFFTNVCAKLQLNIISPLWQKNQKEYMKNLIESKFRFIIVSVTSSGLDDSWLGKEITQSELSNLEKLATKHGFNLNFEGGEAETLVIDCPLFAYPLKIVKAKKIWDGYRGRFEILEAQLDHYAR